MREKKSLAYYDSVPYGVELTFDTEDKVWVARYPDLPGCVASGKTQKAALECAQRFKTEWITAALEDGDDLPEPRPEPSYSGRVLLRLPRSMHEEAARLAEREQVSLNTYIIQAISVCNERSGQRQAFELFEAMLRREFDKLPANARAVLMAIDVRMQAVWLFGQKGEPVSLDQLEKEPSELPPRDNDVSVENDAER
jgi:predicted RNase H-like HicB family nuclease